MSDKFSDDDLGGLEGPDVTGIFDLSELRATLHQEDNMTTEQAQDSGLTSAMTHMAYMRIHTKIDEYGTLVEIPTSFGPRTSHLGEQYALVTEYPGNLFVMESDGIRLSKNLSYPAMASAAEMYGLTPVVASPTPSSWKRFSLWCEETLTVFNTFLD